MTYWPLQQCFFLSTFPKDPCTEKPSQGLITTGQSNLECKTRELRALPSTSESPQETSQLSLQDPHPHADLPSPWLLGDVVDKGTTAEGQLIAALGFVVIERFHSPLRLWGKQEGKGQLGDRSRHGEAEPVLLYSH